MGEKRGGVRWNRGAAGIRDDRDVELDLPRRLRRGMGMTGLGAIVISGLILALAWSVLMEWSHPARAPAREMKRGDGAHRLKAIRDVERLGPQDLEVAIPALSGGLADPEPGNRVAAIEGLLTMVQGIKLSGSDPGQVRAAVAALMGCLEDPQPMVRVKVLQTLSIIVMVWQDAPPIIELVGVAAAMSETVGDPDAQVRLAAVRGLGLIGPRSSEDPPPRLVAALEDESAAVRTAAAQSLGNFHRGLIRLLPSLVKALEGARPEVRPAYLLALKHIRPSRYPPNLADGLRPALVSALGSRDRAVRCLILSSIGEYGLDDARFVLPAVLAVLNEPGEAGPVDSPAGTPANDPVAAAAAALAQLVGTRVPSGPPKKVPPAPEVVPALIKLLRSPAVGRRLAAVNALGSFEPDAALIAALIASSRDRDASVRAAALRAIQADDSKRRSLSVEAIRGALEDDSPQVRDAAASAVRAEAGFVPLIPVLLRHAGHDPDRSVRHMCASALYRLEPPAVTAVVLPMYIEAIDRPGAPAALRASLISTLIGFGPEARVAVPAIVRALRSAEQEPGRDALRRKTDKQFLLGSAQDLEAAEARDHVDLCRNAARALGRLAAGTSSADDAVSALAVALEDPDNEVNQQVVEALAAFGPAARASAPALGRALRVAREQKDRLRAWRMADALGKIDPAAPAAGEAVAFLVEILGSGEIGLRAFAERVLPAFGPAAAPAIPRLVKLSRRSIAGANEELAAIASALGRIAPGTPGEGPALDALVDLLRAERELPHLETVIDALARFGPGASVALPRLHELAKSGDPRVSEAARKGVAAIKAPAG